MSNEYLDYTTIYLAFCKDNCNKIREMKFTTDKDGTYLECQSCKQLYKAQTLYQKCDICEHCDPYEHIEPTIDESRS